MNRSPLTNIPRELCNTPFLYIWIVHTHSSSSMDGPLFTGFIYHVFVGELGARRLTYNGESVHLSDHKPSMRTKLAYLEPERRGAEASNTRGRARENQVSGLKRDHRAAPFHDLVHVEHQLQYVHMCKHIHTHHRDEQ